MLKVMLLTIILLACQSAASADGAQDGDIKINVQKEGEAVVIDLTVTIAATPQETWAVLVDFDHMPQFLSSIQSSKVLERNGNRWKVAQKGLSSHGVFSFAFESIREVDLKPFESIHSHLISGTMKKLEGLTRLFPSGTGTHIVYHSESISNVWVPPVVGVSVVESEIRKQFQEIEAEILKRKASSKVDG
jgi:uncharacterized membrane protein